MRIWAICRELNFSPDSIYQWGEEKTFQINFQAELALLMLVWDFNFNFSTFVLVFFPLIWYDVSRKWDLQVKRACMEWSRAHWRENGKIQLTRINIFTLNEPVKWTRKLFSPLHSFTCSLSDSTDSFRVGKLITKQINSWSMASTLSLYMRTEHCEPKAAVSCEGEKSKMKNRWSKSNSFPTNPTAHTAQKSRLERMLLFAL